MRYENSDHKPTIIKTIEEDIDGDKKFLSEESVKDFLKELDKSCKHEIDEYVARQKGKDFLKTVSEIYNEI